MDHYQIQRQFGKNPDLYAVLVWATQKALKGYGVKHPDMKRQRCNIQRDMYLYGSRLFKQRLRS